ncbi:MAG: hypothetical protein HQL67_06650 [Magnetococcales bacterium]|nr:hypothetical protein [Magnetococcales bacterium]
MKDNSIFSGAVPGFDPGAWSFVHALDSDAHAHEHGHSCELCAHMGNLDHAPKTAVRILENTNKFCNNVEMKKTLGAYHPRIEQSHRPPCEILRTAILAIPPLVWGQTSLIYQETLS